MPKFYARNLLSDKEVIGSEYPSLVNQPYQANLEQHIPLHDELFSSAEHEKMKESESLVDEHNRRVEELDLLQHPRHKAPELESPLDTPELPLPHHQVNQEPVVINEPEHTESVVEQTLDDKPRLAMPIHSEVPAETENHTEVDPVKTLISWNAPARPFRKKDRSFYTTVAILIVLISLIAILAGEKMLIGVLFALGFLVYVLNFIAPEEVEYKMTTQGVTIGDHFYHWKELDSFWFTQKDGFKLLHILTQLKFPGVLILVLGSETQEEEVKRIGVKYLPFHEIAPKSLIDKWAESLQKHFPLENPAKP